MAVIYNLTWSPNPGSYGTLIEYKEAIDDEWITPSDPPNPTMMTSYELLLEPGTTYNIRLSSEGRNCIRKYTILILNVPEGGECCPPGYTLAPDESYCYIIEEIAATPPSSPENTVEANAIQYSTCGSYIYELGYASDGTGTSSQIDLSNAFWVNGAGTCADATTTEGPLNRCGLWATTAMSDQDIGFSVCIDVDEEKVYYVGIACDNYAILKVDGDLVIQQNVAALDTQYSIGGATFKVWHIYPILLSSGPHVIEMIGHNISLVAAMGAEIYDNTAAEIEAAEAYEDLNLLFSTKDYIGQPVQLGTDGIGYTCPEGYSLSCDIPYVCTRIITTPTISC